MINNIKFVDELKHHGIKELNERIMEGMKVPPNNLVEELKEYFNKTSREQVLKDWEETVDYDSGNVVAGAFINSLERRRKVIESTNKDKPFETAFSSYKYYEPFTDEQLEILKLE